jgi:integrase/recombinase XerD
MDLTSCSDKNEEINRLFEQYIKEMRYLRNFSPKTIITYQDCFKNWLRHAGGIPTQESLDALVIGMREKGLQATSCNVTIMAFNAFLTWLKNKGVIGPLRLKKLPVERKQMRVFSDEEIKRVLAFKPQTKNQRRAYAIFCTILDCGFRISECLSIERSRVNFDALTITVKGKGKKERTVPMSLELRKVLFAYATKARATKFDCVYLFCTANGTKMTYRNAYRDLEVILNKTKVGKGGIDGFFHSVRRKFARSYVKSGGNVLYLQRALGHADLSTTQLYVSPDEEDLQRVHSFLSPLSNIKR